MEKLYKRIGNLEEKIKEISLPYLQWKLLFLIGESTGTDKLLPVVQKSAEEVEKALAGLVNAGLIETVAGAEAEQPEAAEAVPEEVAEEQAEPEVSTEETIPEEEAEPAPDETSIIMDAETEAEEHVDVAAEEETEDTETEEDEVVPADELVTEVTSQIPDSEADTEISGFDELPEEPEISIAGEEEIAQEDAQEDESESEMTQFIEELGELEQGLGLSDEPETETATAEPKPEPETVDEVVSVSGKKTILVIDDSLVIRKMVEMALEEEDFDLQNSSTGRDGLELMDKTEPVLVILDLILPDMNGIDVLKTVKASKGIPVIMLSGKDNPQLIENAKAEGADAFLPKPFKDEDLVEKVKRLTNQ